METTWGRKTSLLTTKKDLFTVDTVVWATPSPTRSTEMATPTTSKTNLSLTSSRERARRTSKINRISRQISQQALLQGFLNFLGYLHFFLTAVDEHLRQLMSIYKRPDLNLKKNLDVSFSGECGADMGGPSKEFFHVSLASLKKVDPVYNFQLFTGEEGHLVPVYGADVLSSGCFQMVGKLLAHSILHNGDALIGLAPPVKEYLVSGSVEEAGKLVTPADLPDVELRTLLEEKVKINISIPFSVPSLN